MIDMPKITVVTVVKNARGYIERSLLSVITQSYKNFEYIVFDACSEDGTTDIILKYKDYINHIVIENDNGPAHALHKAFKIGTGDIYCWINADDYYLPGTFESIAKFFVEHESVEIVYGNYYVAKNNKYWLKYKLPFDFEIAAHRYLMIAQPACFWRSSIYHKVGGIDISLHYAFDFDLFLRIASQIKRQAIVYIDQAFAVFEIHPASKTSQGDDAFKVERKMVRSKLNIQLRGIYKKLKKIFLTLRLIKLMLITHGIRKSIKKLSIETSSIRPPLILNRFGKFF